MRKYSERDLFAWGDKLMELQEWANEQGESVIQRMVDYKVRLDSPPPGDKILCPEMPRWMRAIHKYANHLDRQQRRAVAAWYSAQLLDGQRPTKREVAKAIGMDITKFDSHLQRGKKRLLFLLNS